MWNGEHSPTGDTELSDALSSDGAFLPLESGWMLLPEEFLPGVVVKVDKLDPPSERPERFSGFDT